MKSPHRPGLPCWSALDAAWGVAVSATLLVTEPGDVGFDPMTVSEHDAAHIDRLVGSARSGGGAGGRRGEPAPGWQGAPVGVGGGVQWIRAGREAV